MKVAMEVKRSDKSYILTHRHRQYRPPSPSPSSHFFIIISFFLFFFFVAFFSSSSIAASAGRAGTKRSVLSTNSTKRTTSPSSAASNSSAVVADFIALLAVKASLRDPHGVLSSWRSSSSAGNVAGNGRSACSGEWLGVKCSRETGRVIALHLPSKGLGGTLASEIGALTSLQSLSLHNNAISGPIPSSISSLLHLRGLYLFHNLFIGPIPSFLPPSLRALDIAYNRLSGPIPSSLASLSRLQTLILSHNQLIGSIPPSLTMLAYLRLMNLSNNLLNGAFPSVMASSSSPSISSLRELDLSYNGLSGSLPAQMVAQMASLTILALNDNDFSGLVPSALGDMTELASLDISHNRFDGNLPPSMASLSKLTSFNCSYNNLTGEVPKLARSFDTSAFMGNDGGLCGFSPSSPCPATASSTPTLSAETGGGEVNNKKSRKFHASALGFIIVGAVIAVLLAMCVCSILFLYCFGSKQKKARLGPVVEGKAGRKDGGGRSMEASGSREKRKKMMKKDGHGGDGGEAEKKKEEEERHAAGGKLVHSAAAMAAKMGYFSADDLLCATAEVVGKGAYGTVYKAALPAPAEEASGSLGDGQIEASGSFQPPRDASGSFQPQQDASGSFLPSRDASGSFFRYVAVKRLREGVAVREQKEFEAALAALSSCRHPNLLSLLAYYCGLGDEKLLVFDFMHGGSLASLLLLARDPTTPAFTWQQRMNIAVGAARGLAHLHHHEKTVHGNLTSKNILLDMQLNPKLSDFGLWRLMTQSANSTVIATAGALGYRAPELTKMKNATPKSDVYSFGIVLLELLTGKTSSCEHGKASSSSIDLADWVASLLMKDEWGHEIFDPELARNNGLGPKNEDCITCLQLAMACVKVSPRERPDIAEVVRKLEGLRPGVEQ